jgi:hypothetical protein
MSLRAGTVSTIKVKGKGGHLHLAPPPFDTPVFTRVFAGSGGTCFAADFTAAKKNTTTGFRAKLP